VKEVERLNFSTYSLTSLKAYCYNILMAFANPAENLKALELSSGDIVVDLGAGPGAYTLEVAKRVAPEGKVYAVDIQKEILEKLKKDADQAGLSNVEIVWGDIETQGGSGLSDKLADKALVSNVLSQAQASYPLALEVKRVLKDGGKVAVIDWTDSFGGLGPHPSQVVTAEAARQVFEQAGFKFLSQFPAGDHYYGLIFSK